MTIQAQARKEVRTRLQISFQIMEQLGFDNSIRTESRVGRVETWGGRTDFVIGNKILRMEKVYRWPPEIRRGSAPQVPRH